LEEEALALEKAFTCLVMKPSPQLPANYKQELEILHAQYLRSHHKIFWWLFKN
jgi:hypothetical protein